VRSVLKPVWNWCCACTVSALEGALSCPCPLLITFTSSCQWGTFTYWNANDAVSKCSEFFGARWKIPIAWRGTCGTVADIFTHSRYSKIDRTSSAGGVWSKRGNINLAALVTIVLCNTLVARCCGQLIGPADWVFVTLGPLRCDWPKGGCLQYIL